MSTLLELGVDLDGVIVMLLVESSGEVVHLDGKVLGGDFEIFTWLSFDWSSRSQGGDVLSLVVVSLAVWLVVWAWDVWVLVLLTEGSDNVLSLVVVPFAVWLMLWARNVWVLRFLSKRSNNVHSLVVVSLTEWFMFWAWDVWILGLLEEASDNTLLLVGLSFAKWLVLWAWE